MNLTARPRSSRILTALGSLQAGDGYSLRLSRRSCAAIERDPSQPGYLDIEHTYKGDLDRAFVVDNRAGPRIPPRARRATRSIVLTGGQDEGALKPRACGIMDASLDVDIVHHE